ncbi:MAG: YvrJ family protein [Thermoanaerobacteraceae bacterium]|nr:YvrJ family protein [Thermoanaerobacteraceae bacterium]
MEDLWTQVGNVGFPMVIAFYLLVRMEPLIKELQKSVTLLTVVVARLGGLDYQEAKGLLEGKGVSK